MVVQASTARVLFTVGTEEPTADSLTKKLMSFGELPNGWHFGEGIPVSADTLKEASSILAWGSQLQLGADVFPGIDGECMIAFYEGNKCVRVIVYPDGGLGVRVERSEGDRFVDEIEPADNVPRREAYRHVVRLLDGHSWISLAPFISSTTTLASGISWSSYSRTLRATGEADPPCLTHAVLAR